MDKYKYIIFHDVNIEIIREVNLWRAVIIQHLNDLSSNASKKSRFYGYKKNSFDWIFKERSVVGTKNLNYEINDEFKEVCELAFVDALSVVKQALFILRKKNLQ